jgi:hypothetical protein
LLVGLIGMYVEIIHPGPILPGVVGAMGLRWRCLRSICFP